jgi:hypothetical protein
MRTRFGKLGSITVALALAGAMAATAAMAQTPTRFTSVVGTVSGNGTWGRTIIDSEPNGANGKAQAGFTINTPYTIGMTAEQLAAAYRAASITTLPPAPNSLHGYGAVTENSVRPTIRLGKQTGTWAITGEASLPPGITLNNFLPVNAEHAPAVSPAGLMALAASMSAMAWWARRRRFAA